MKKIIISLVILALISPYANASYGYTKRVTILSLNKTTKNLTIEHENKLWLLHYTGKCDELTEGKEVILSITNTLNANGDLLKVSSYRTCPIDQAQVITGKLNIDYVYADETNTIVTDENGDKYWMYVDSRCTTLPRYWKSYVYIFQGGPKIAKGDYVYLPRNEGKCSITYLDEYAESTSVEKPEGDIKSPTMVSEVTAVPKNGAVSLSWKPASDDVAIDYYIISYSPYHINTENFEVNSMPNRIETSDTSYEITGLTNKRTYYFYVLAVDTSGNQSSDWSPEETAMPQSSINVNTSSGYEDLIIKKSQETVYSFLFTWPTLPKVLRQTVILEVDGQRQFISTEWIKDYIRINKNADRKGKEMKLIVRQYDIYSQMFEDTIEFDF